MTGRDVMPRGAARAAERTMLRAMHVSLLVDHSGRVVRSLPRAIDPFGLRNCDVVGTYASDLFVDDDSLSARALLHRAARGDCADPVILRMHRAGAAETVVRVSARDREGTIVVRIRQCDEVERHAFRTATSGRARFDPLTGLPNRLLLWERVGAALASGPQTLVLLDVDRFREVETAVGTRGADRIYVEIADRIKHAVGPHGIVGISRGQFAALVPGTGDDISTHALIEGIRSAVAAPIMVTGDAIAVTACLGIATSSDDTDSLFADAELALAHAKSLGPGHDATFDPALRRRAVRHVELQSDLARAIVDDELRLEFQPIVDLATDAVVAYEALVRWQHPQRGLLAPHDFLGIAQRTGAGAAIDRWVLLEACRRGAHWARTERRTTICVNVAPEQFAIAGSVGHVEDALAATGFDPALLLLEITEWSILADVGAARDTLAELDYLGVRVALDDYGTGYSSLADLAALHVHELKIDTTFVAGLGIDRVRTAIVHAIVGLARALGIAVVAEGVENPAQVFALRALGCDFGQGFHFGSPGPGPALITGAA